jgi:hypothetical protein
MRQPPARRASLGLAVALLGALAAAAGVAVWVLASDTSRNAPQPSAVAQAAFEEETGVQIVRVALVGAGGLVDLRYRVVDPDKAEIVHEDVPVLVDEQTGEVIDTFFMGHRHDPRSVPKAGVTYPLLYVNERGLIEHGDTVTVVIGDSRLEHVPVR